MLAPLLAAALATVAPAPEAAIGRLEDGAVDAGAAAFARAGERVGLAAILHFPDGRCLAGRAGISLAGRPCEIAPPEVAASARWILAVAEPRDYDNTAACTAEALRAGCHAPITYREVELPELRGALVVDASRAEPLAAPGAHRLALRVAWEGAVLAAPPALAEPPTDASVPAMFELVVRRDDGYVGRLTELLGVPFSLFPVRLPGVGHQADRRLAADCVALVIYGQRRLGRAVGYMPPLSLRRHLDRIGGAERLIDAGGRVADLGSVREGDVLHFGFQTAVLSVDRPPLGQLDADDLVIHSYHGLAEERRLGELPYRDRPFELMRWRPR